MHCHPFCHSDARNSAFSMMHWCHGIHSAHLYLLDQLCTTGIMENSVRLHMRLKKKGKFRGSVTIYFRAEYFLGDLNLLLQYHKRQPMGGAPYLGSDITGKQILVCMWHKIIICINYRVHIIIGYTQWTMCSVLHCCIICFKSTM